MTLRRTTVQHLDVTLIDDCYWISGDLVGDDAIAMFTELREVTAAAEWNAFRLDISGVTSTDSVGLKALLRLSDLLPRVRITAIPEGFELTLAILGMTAAVLEPPAQRPADDRLIGASSGQTNSPLVEAVPLRASGSSR